VLRTCQMAPAFPDVTSPSKGYRCWQQHGLLKPSRSTRDDTGILLDVTTR
jgi:hypothetical protein